MKVKEKLIEFARFATTSDETSTTIPSTATQRTFADHLVEKLHSMGIEDAFVDEYGYVYGSLKGNCDCKVVGLIAHMDTSDAVCGTGVDPQVIENYDGKDIVLKNGVVTSVERFPELKELVGKTLITSDGNTLLGADDKAGIAIIFETLEMLLKHPEIKHGLIRFCFTPDEEIGRGVDYFNYDLFKSDYTYTLDGGRPNGISYECFNACSAHVEIKGVSTHPGDAKNKMINALQVAHEFHGLLPEYMVPEHTEGRDGFNHLVKMSGSTEKAVMDYIIRNFDYDLMMKQKQDFKRIAMYLNEVYPSDTVDLTLVDSYRNMKEKFEADSKGIDLVKQAMSKLGLQCKEELIRGGTDGAQLSWHGLPCPNIGTGGYFVHGIHELACVQEMEMMVKLVLILVNLATI